MSRFQRWRSAAWALSISLGVMLCGVAVLCTEEPVGAQQNHKGSHGTSAVKANGSTPADLLRAILARTPGMEPVAATFEHWIDMAPFGHCSRIETLDLPGGETATIYILSVPALSVPGTDWSMAILVVDGQAVDWYALQTSNRGAEHSIEVADLDANGDPELVVAARRGTWGLLDERVQEFNGRMVFQVFRITSEGLISCLADDSRGVPVRFGIDEFPEGLEASLVTIPEVLFADLIFELTLRLTNDSSKAIDLDDWIPDFHFRNGGRVAFLYPLEGAIRPSESLVIRVTAMATDFPTGAECLEVGIRLLHEVSWAHDGPRDSRGFGLQFEGDK